MSTRSLVIAACAVLIVIALVWWWRGPAGVEVPGPGGGQVASGLDSQEVVELLHRLNVGVAHLENDQLKDAVGDFTALEQAVPGEVAPRRNMMIARLLILTKLEASNPDQPVAIREAELAHDALRHVDPDSPVTHVLAARLAAAQDDTAAALRLLQQATAVAPNDLPAWYEQFTLARYSTDEALRQQADAALVRAFELAPTNLVVLLDRLLMQVDSQDPKIVDTLAAGAPRWQQLAKGIQSRVGVDLNQYVADARAAALAGDWPLVRRNILIIKNVVTPEDATRSDRRLVERHPLEFVLDSLSAPMMAVVKPAEKIEAPVATKFTTAADNPQLPVSSTVQSLVTADFDLDTLLDAACLHEGRLDVFRHQGDAWTTMCSYDSLAGMQHLVAVDLDDDVPMKIKSDDDAEPTGHPRCHQADLDLVLFGTGGVVALQNVQTEGGRELQPIELPAALASEMTARQIVPADLDMDGDLDLLVLTETGPQMWGNAGNLKFDASLLSVAGVPEGMSFTAALPIDWDDDLDLDIILADVTGHLGWLESLRHGEFLWRDLGADVGMSVTAIEPLDRNGAWDLLLAGDGGLQRLESSRPIAGRVGVRAPRSVIDTPLQSLDVADLNNDGALDVVGLSPEGMLILLGWSDATLTEEPLPLLKGAGEEPPRCLDIADMDGNGLLDLITGTGAGVQVLDNRTSPGGGWIDVSLLAVQVKGGESSVSGRVNHYGIGSLLELRSGTHRQRQMVRQPVVHFGLGSAAQADTVRVLWTNGVPENVIEPEARTFICERQTLKGSCPYLYGWNGEEFAFITDLCWASPIGLVGIDGRLVPARPWEHLKIAPDQLVPRDGKYELRLTEELWEAAYFDAVQLTAVDHPQEVEIVTNEKVGPPALAEHRLYTITQRRIPLSATDQQRRDVLPLVRQADERYVNLFDHKLRQGYTEPTTLELDLGDLSGAKQITLFLTGWIYPTDTTINVALSQNASLDGPVPPSLAVPDADGGWQTVIPYTGFPGGKTKTIAIDLSEAFLTDDYRIRLSTSMEIYWDAVCLTVDEPTVEVRQTTLRPLRAELRSRGVSAAIVHPQYGPERYDYNVVSPSPWRPMDGNFTRFGDVRELLANEDSRLLVMGSGDEVVLEFAAPPPPPPGWVRSFVIRNVGWDKDADLHTVYGQTTEPLPLRHMSTYPWPADEAPIDKQYAEYLRTYQTRRMVP